MEVSVTHERNSERGHFLPKEFLNFITLMGKKKKPIRRCFPVIWVCLGVLWIIFKKKFKLFWCVLLKVNFKKKLF